MIRLQIAERYKDLVSSYWFVPLLCAFGGIALVVVAAWLDALAVGGEISALAFFDQATPAGRRALLSTIAGSSIAVAGTVFSISMVVLSSASSQLGPRLLPNFFKRISTQFVLGSFIATFIAALLVLAQVSDSVGGPNPHSYGIGLSFSLAVLSLALLVYFLQSVSLFIQAPLVIDDVATDLVRVLEQQTVESGSEDPVSSDDEAALLDSFEGGECAHIDALRDGYIQAIDTRRGCKLAADYDICIKLPRRPGQFVSADDAIALVLPADGRNEALTKKIRELIVIGAQRTNSKDVEYVVDQLVEIAVRALSPGINDPITAINCIDRLGGALGVLASREFPGNVCCDDAGKPRLYMQRLTDKGVMDAVFNQLRQHASNNVAVSIRLMEMAASLGSRISRKALKQALHDQIENLYAACRRDIDGEPDLRDIEERYHRAAEVLGAKPLL
jgi:uncharacterized membrane protein